MTFPRPSFSAGMSPARYKHSPVRYPTPLQLPDSGLPVSALSAQRGAPSGPAHDENFISAARGAIRTARFRTPRVTDEWHSGWPVARPSATRTGLCARESRLTERSIGWRAFLKMTSINHTFSCVMTVLRHSLLKNPASRFCSYYTHLADPLISHNFHFISDPHFLPS